MYIEIVSLHHRYTRLYTTKDSRTFCTSERVNKQTKTSSIGVRRKTRKGKRFSFPFKGFNFERMIIIIVMMMTKMPTTEINFASAVGINTFLIVRDFTHFQMKNRNRVRSKSL